MSPPVSRAGRPARQPVWLAVAAVAALTLWQSLGFGLGTRANVGSGLFPMALSGFILAISVLGFLLPDGEAPEPFAGRPLLAVAAGVAAFILLIDRAGMLPAVVASMLASYLGQTERGHAVFLLFACLFGAAAWLLFARLLNVPVALIGQR